MSLVLHGTNGITYPDARTQLEASKAVQIVTDSYLTESTDSTGFPNDNTKPQNDEGFEIMTVAITPKNASSTLVVEYELDVAGTYGITAAALFEDSDADAIDVKNGSSGQVTGRYIVSAANTTERTYKVRVGDITSQACRVNYGGSGTARFNNACGCYMSVTEYAP